MRFAARRCFPSNETPIRIGSVNHESETIGPSAATLPLLYPQNQRGQRTKLLGIVDRRAQLRGAMIAQCSCESIASDLVSQACNVIRDDAAFCEAADADMEKCA